MYFINAANELLMYIRTMNSSNYNKIIFSLGIISLLISYVTFAQFFTISRLHNGKGKRCNVDKVRRVRRGSENFFFFFFFLGGGEDVRGLGIIPPPTGEKTNLGKIEPPGKLPPPLGFFFWGQNIFCCWQVGDLRWIPYSVSGKLT